MMVLPWWDYRARNWKFEGKWSAAVLATDRPNRNAPVCLWTSCSPSAAGTLSQPEIRNLNQILSETQGCLQRTAGGHIHLEISLDSNLRVVYMTAYTPSEIAEQGVIELNVAVLAKPFSPKGLELAIRRALGARDAAGA
jgi:hypothetical protein